MLRIREQFYVRGWHDVQPLMACLRHHLADGGTWPPMRAKDGYAVRETRRTGEWRAFVVTVEFDCRDGTQAVWAKFMSARCPPDHCRP